METAQPLPTPNAGPFITEKERVRYEDKHKPNRMEKQAHTRDIPKKLRPHPGLIGKSEGLRALGHLPELQDPIKSLGHPARPRKRR